MALLTKEQIRQSDDIRREPVDVPEWGGTVLVQTMSGTQRDALERQMMIIKGSGKKRTVEQDLTNFRARLVVYSCVNEDGTPLFDEGDLVWVATKSGIALNRVAEVASRLSGISEADAEELAGNSESAANEDSGSS